MLYGGPSELSFEEIRAARWFAARQLAPEGRQLGEKAERRAPAENAANPRNLREKSTDSLNGAKATSCADVATAREAFSDENLFNEQQKLISNKKSIRNEAIAQERITEESRLTTIAKSGLTGAATSQRMKLPETSLMADQQKLIGVDISMRRRPDGGEMDAVRDGLDVGKGSGMAAQRVPVYDTDDGSDSRRCVAGVFFCLFV